MVERVFITSQKKANFICPKCQRAKIADVSKYANLDRRIKVNVKCPCGHSFSVLLEKRKQYRKQTNIPGSFIHFTDSKVTVRGLMTVCDLSLTGMKLQVDYEYQFPVGDVLEVSFLLDNPQRTVMHKKVIVKNVNLPYVGTEFPITEREDKTLGFYLLK
jgi:hypothetical protein